MIDKKIIGGKDFRGAIHFNINGRTILALKPDGTYRYYAGTTPAKAAKRVARLIAKELYNIVQAEHED